MTITVRRAIRSDMPTILKMTRDLAIYLKHDGPRHSLDDLYRDGGFDGEYAYFFALLAEDSDVIDSNGLPTAVGFTFCSYVFTWDGRTIHMNNLLVSESHRSKGIGKQILVELMKHAKETGCNRIDFYAEKSNPARIFYEKMGAIDFTERHGQIYYRICKDVINSI